MNVFEVQSAISSSPPSITVLYFAAARTAIGVSSERISVPNDGLPLKDLAGVLDERHKGTGLGEILKRCAWSVNDEMAGEGEEDGGEIVLRGGEEVGVICPVSGG